MRKNTQDELLSADQVAEILRNRRTGKDKINKQGNAPLVVNHEQHADLMIKYISNIPMDNIIKTIMIMRIGSPLLKKKPMTHLAIGLSLGMSEIQVKELEILGIEEYANMYSRSNGQSIVQNKSLIHDALNRVVSSNGRDPR